MANICSFDMKVKGERENIERFYNALTQNGTTWMGRGAEVSIDYINDNTCLINGWCKWSLQSALVDNAISMRTNPDRWYKLDTSYEYITLWEACEKWDLKMEAYSAESGCCFQEHFKYDENSILDECIEWNEYCLDDFETKKEAEEELGIEITDDEWENCDFIGRGGYGEWKYSI